MDNRFTIDEVRDFWDNVADSYESSHDHIREAHFQRFEEAHKHIVLKPGMNVLNVWSRTGEAIPYLRKQCSDINLFNLELSPRFIEIAKKHFPEELFAETDLTRLQFEASFFDYILSLETLEHTPKPLEFLKECRRVLKPGGILVMSLPPAAVELPAAFFRLFVSDHGEGPHRFLSSKTVKRFFYEAGLNILAHKATLLIPVGPKFIRDFGERIIQTFPDTFISELGIRQFYIASNAQPEV
jgi:ubiquinone/menaquinone biosynthesis C-methylase UbiE